MDNQLVPITAVSFPSSSSGRRGPWSKWGVAAAVGLLLAIGGAFSIHEALEAKNQAFQEVAKLRGEREAQERRIREMADRIAELEKDRDNWIQVAHEITVATRQPARVAQSTEEKRGSGATVAKKPKSIGGKILAVVKKREVIDGAMLAAGPFVPASLPLQMAQSRLGRRMAGNVVSKFKKKNSSTGEILINVGEMPLDRR